MSTIIARTVQLIIQIDYCIVGKWSPALDSTLLQMASIILYLGLVLMHERNGKSIYFIEIIWSLIM